jgi:hypothetical protein
MLTFQLVMNEMAGWIIFDFSVGRMAVMQDALHTTATPLHFGGALTLGQKHFYWHEISTGKKEKH